MGWNKVIAMRNPFQVRTRLQAFVAICLGLTWSVAAGELPVSALYRIEAGAYTAVGGFAGSLTVPLPNGVQTYAELTTGLPDGTATLRILGTNESAVFLELSGGRVSGSQISFRGPIRHPDYPLIDAPTEAAYVITFSASALSLSGTITARVPCCDIPGLFTHDDVQAFRRPDLFTSLLPTVNFGLSTNQVVAGDSIEIRWSGYNNGTSCLLDFGRCPERFGPARGPWQDAVSLVSGTNRWLLGVAEFDGVLPVGGGYRSTGSFRIPEDLAPGIYGIEIRIDYQPTSTNGIVVEQNEANNSAVRAGLVTVLPSLAISEVARMPDGSIRLRIMALGTGAFRVQGCPSVSSGEWADLATFPEGSVVKEWVDHDVNRPARFYRVVAP